MAYFNLENWNIHIHKKYRYLGPYLYQRIKNTVLLDNLWSSYIPVVATVYDDIDVSI